MWTPVLAHFRPNQLEDFSTYNTQVLFLTGFIISKAHYNDEYNYVPGIVKDGVLHNTRDLDSFVILK